MDNEPAAPRTRAKLSPESIEKVRPEWGPWAETLTTQSDYVDAATEAAIAGLEAGLPADLVAAMIRLRAGISSGYADNRSRVLWELAHYERARQEARELGAWGLISKEAAARIDHDYAARSAALGAWSQPMRGRAVVAAAAALSRSVSSATPGQVAEAPPPAPAAAPVAPSRPPISLRDLFAEHSVLILASLGAFLLVVATVLFELYGTTGFGGGVRLAAVVALDLIFAAAGYIALGRPDLRAVGQVYPALAPLLRPLAVLPARTFLGLPPPRI